MNSVFGSIMNTHLLVKLRVALALIFVLSLSLREDAHAQEFYEIANAFPDLTFSLPIDIESDGLGWLYVVEQAGKIHRFASNSSATEAAVFLDLSDRVHVDNEAGLLSIVFHPEFESNGYFYIYYIVQEPLRSVLSRYSIDKDDPSRADPDSELILLEISQPTDRHNGGGTAFDADGYLFLSLGDGSMGRDAFNQAQDLTTLLGSIIRIDVDQTEDGLNYGIPADNPFVGNTSGYREEIYAYGFRNPWRFSIDEETGRIWVGDVGEEDWEEVNVVVKGGNYGWPIVEGPECYRPAINCETEGLIPPVYYYGHDVGRSITGGYVYRGSRVPELVGKYIFADWGERQVFALTYAGDPLENPVSVEQIADSKRFISSFGLDETGELLMTFTFLGTVNKFEDLRGAGAEPPAAVQGIALEMAGPNPFSEYSAFQISSDTLRSARVVVYDVLGREVAELFRGDLTPHVYTDINFDASDLASGTYVVRLEADGHFATQLVTVSR